MRFGYFLSAILLHLCVFLLVATVVIFKAPSPPPNDQFVRVAMPTPLQPPPPQPSSSGAEANNALLEPQPVVVPVVTPMSAITSSQNAFTVDISKIESQTSTHLNLPAPQGTGLSTGGGDTSGIGNGFGSSTGNSDELSGYLIDLKQTRDKKPTGMNVKRYDEILTGYVSQGWDDSILEPYYQTQSALHTYDYAISTRPSEEAPKAFGVEKEVQPGLWVIHYHGKVEAPQAGEYRLAGFADNVMVVKIRGETVLDGGWDSLSDKAILHELLPYAMPSYVHAASPIHNPHLKIGPSFHLDTADPVDMDVLIGDDGGVCSFFLMIEKVGNTYENLPDGTPKLPFFQIGSKPVPTFQKNEEHPPYSATPESWQGR